MRLDQYLLQKELCPSRSKAQELIKSGHIQILIDGEFKLIQSASYKIKGEPEVKITQTELLKFVARSGLKLESALSYIKVETTGLKCMDVGSSTGGFSHCLLEAGAAQVDGFDVGQGQLNAKLSEYNNFKNFEKLNAKDISSHSYFKDQKLSYDLIVVDVSFISLTHILTHIKEYLRPEGALLALVKPQFELGQSLLKKGLVKSEDAYDPLKDKIINHCSGLDLKVIDYFESQLPGKEGNKEFFVYAKA